MHYIELENNVSSFKIPLNYRCAALLPLGLNFANNQHLSFYFFFPPPCSAEQMFWEIMRLRREMNVAKLGFYLTDQGQDGTWNTQQESIAVTALGNCGNAHVFDQVEQCCSKGHQQGKQNMFVTFGNAIKRSESNQHSRNDIKVHVFLGFFFLKMILFPDMLERFFLLHHIPGK